MEELSLCCSPLCSQCLALGLALHRCLSLGWIPRNRAWGGILVQLSLERVLSGDREWGKMQSKTGDELQTDPLGNSSSGKRTGPLLPCVIFRPWDSPSDGICVYFWTRPLLFCWEQFVLCGSRDSASSSSSYTTGYLLLCCWLFPP